MNNYNSGLQTYDFQTQTYQMVPVQPHGVQSSHEQQGVITLASLGLDPLGNPFRVVAPMVYVGRICTGALQDPDFEITKMLGICDKVLKWKITEGASFGFCEYETFRGVYFAKQCLQNLQLGTRSLLIKINDKVERGMQHYIRSNSIEDTTVEEVRMKICDYVRDRQDGFVQLAEQAKDEPKEEEKEEVRPETMTSDEYERYKREVDEKILSTVFGGDKSLKANPLNSTELVTPVADVLHIPHQRMKNPPLSKYFRDNPREKERARRRHMRERDLERDYYHGMMQFVHGEETNAEKFDRLILEKQANEEMEKKRRESLDNPKNEDVEINIDEILLELEDDERETERELEEQKLEASRKRKLEELEKAKHEEELKKQIENRELMERERWREDERQREAERVAEESTRLAEENAGCRDIRFELRPKVVETSLDATNPVFHSAEEEPEKKNLPLLEADALDAEHRERYLELKREKMKELIQQVPKERVDLFAYKLDWEALDEDRVVEKKVRPWLLKKLQELVGEVDESMVDLFVSKLEERQEAKKFLQETAEPIFLEEADDFVFKLYRLLIFESLRARFERTQKL